MVNQPICPECNGTGEEYGPNREWLEVIGDCQFCDGTGLVPWEYMPEG